MIAVDPSTLHAGDRVALPPDGRRAVVVDVYGGGHGKARGDDGYFYQIAPGSTVELVSAAEPKPCVACGEPAYQLGGLHACSWECVASTFEGGTR